MHENNRAAKPICPQCGEHYLVNSSPFSLLVAEKHICESCFLKRPIHLQRFILDDCIVMSLYDYNEDFSALIYRYKVLGDAVLAGGFIGPLYEVVADFIGKRTIVCPPSSKEHNDLLGYKHLELTLKSVGFSNYMSPFIKVDNWRQSDHNAHDRSQIGKHIQLKETVIIPEDIVLFDDIFTTGNTLRACIRLLRRRKPGIRIRILVLSKVILR